MYRLQHLPLVLIALISLNLLNAQLIDQEEFNQIESKVIEWRRDFHEHPELSNREFETAKKIAQHLGLLGIEVQTGVAHTGVVGLLKGDMPGAVIALRADIDALPVTERNDLPFKSTVKAQFLGGRDGRNARLRARYTHCYSYGCS
jgi:Metal-dependent amidase/aminoacylase/carboxypeptidase